MSVYGYARVSTLRQANEGESLAVQQRQIEGYAHMHGLTIDAVCVEEGVSGSIPIRDRKVGGPLFDMLERGDVLIAAKLDRLFRSALDALTVVEELKRRGVKLHLLDLGGDIAGNGLSKLFLTIVAAVAEAERDRIRERIQGSKSDQKARGRFLGGRRPPFGWAKTAEGMLVEAPDEQKALRAAERKLAGGASLRDVSAMMRAAGFDISHEGLRKVMARRVAEHGASA